MDVGVAIAEYQLGGPEIGPKFPTASLKQGLQVRTQLGETLETCTLTKDNQYKSNDVLDANLYANSIEGLQTKKPLQRTFLYAVRIPAGFVCMGL